jgi:hypothetical protein
MIHSEVVVNQLWQHLSVSGGKEQSHTIYACNIHAAVYQYIDLANSLPTLSESYFALACCSESSGIIPLSAHLIGLLN